MIPGAQYDKEKESELFVLREVFKELGYNDTQFLDFLLALKQKGFVIRPEMPKLTYRNVPEMTLEHHGRKNIP